MSFATGPLVKLFDHFDLLVVRRSFDQIGYLFRSLFRISSSLRDLIDLSRSTMSSLNYPIRFLFRSDVINRKIWYMFSRDLSEWSDLSPLEIWSNMNFLLWSDMNGSRFAPALHIHMIWHPYILSKPLEVFSDVGAGIWAWCRCLPHPSQIKCSL